MGNLLLFLKVTLFNKIAQRFSLKLRFLLKWFVADTEMRPLSEGRHVIICFPVSGLKGVDPEKTKPPARIEQVVSKTTLNLLLF